MAFGNWEYEDAAGHGIIAQHRYVVYMYAKMKAIAK